MPAAAATATAVDGGEGGVTRVDTRAVVDNGQLEISEQDDRLYRHITLPNKMQVDTGILSLAGGPMLSARVCSCCAYRTSVGRSDSSLVNMPEAGLYISCRAARQSEHCCRCTNM